MIDEPQSLVDHRYFRRFGMFQWPTHAHKAAFWGAWRIESHTVSLASRLLDLLVWWGCSQPRNEDCCRTTKYCHRCAGTTKSSAVLHGVGVRVAWRRADPAVVRALLYSRTGPTIERRTSW